MAIAKGVMTFIGAWFIVSGLFVFAYSSLKAYTVRKYASLYDNEITKPPLQPASTIFHHACELCVSGPPTSQTLPVVDPSASWPSYAPASTA